MKTVGTRRASLLALAFVGCATGEQDTASPGGTPMTTVGGTSGGSTTVEPPADDDSGSTTEAVDESSTSIGELTTGETQGVDDASSSSSGEISGCADDSCSICASRPDALFCHAFEDDAYVPNPFNTGNLALSSPGFSGASALEATVGAGGDQRASVEGTIAPLLSGTLYARAYVYIPAAAVIDQFDLFSLRTWEAPGGEAHCSLALRDAAVSVWCTNADNFGTIVESDTALPRDQWTCVEWALALGEVAGETEVFVDETRVAAANGTTDLMGGTTVFNAGIEYAPSGQGALSVRMDELILDINPIGCDAEGG